MSLTSKRIYEFGEFRLKTGARLLELSGQPVPLGSKAFEVLTCLVVHAGSVVTKDQLLKAVWPESFVEEGNLSQQVFALRRALGLHASFIVTIPGRGYQFTERVREVADLSAPPPADSGSFVLQRTRERTHIVIEETSELQDTVVPTGPLEPSTPPQAAGLSSSRASVEDAGIEMERATVAGGYAISANDGGETSWRKQQLTLPPPARARRIWPTVAAGLLVLGSGILVARYVLRAPANQRVVIAELDNRTQDPGLDVVLRDALEIDLDQSPYIDVMSESETLSTLRLMDRKPETSLVPPVAREVCQRSNREVLIAGSVASVGRNYLLTLEATDCDSGKILAGTKAEVTSKDQMLPALDQASESLRKALGESSQSLERFQVPIAQATTSSLEALQQYSIGEYLLGRMGKEESDALPFFERAVELDAQFAMAQAAVATGYYSLGEYTVAGPYYQRAFDLSGQVSEKERLYIRAHYFADDKRDLWQGLRVYQMWADTYPKDWGPWLDMADEHTQLGQYPEAIAAAEHALKLDSSRGIIYGVLARAYMHIGRFGDAKSTAARAFSLGKDSNMLHATLLEIAFAEKDEPAIAREIFWSRSRVGEWNFLDLEARSAAQQGRYNAATELFQAAYNSAFRENLPEKANGILLDQASSGLDAGLESAARDALKSMTEQESANPNVEYLRAELANDAETKQSLVAYLGSGTPDTREASADSARIRARMALNQGRPLLAIADLEGISDYGSPESYSIAAERADAFRMAGQPAKAAEEYRRILENPGVDPVSPLIPLARLGLARAESQTGQTKESKADYEILFSQWKEADANLPVLVAARKEYAALTSAH
jgi:DNA-binding winged helix-turn-helix (wHTH) protein/tetratricopeptide (TPR) repeat protein